MCMRVQRRHWRRVWRAPRWELLRQQRQRQGRARLGVGLAPRAAEARRPPQRVHALFLLFPLSYISAILLYIHIILYTLYIHFSAQPESGSCCRRPRRRADRRRRARLADERAVDAFARVLGAISCVRSLGLCFFAPVAHNAVQPAVALVEV